MNAARRPMAPHRGGRMSMLLRGLHLPAGLRYAAGAWQGRVYRLAGRHPDLHVPDDLLADRVRSEIGTLLKDLDLPRIHVLVEHGVATLHGEVGVPVSAALIEDTVAQVPGIRAVRSHLHVGLLPGDTRPSAGRVLV